MSTCVVFSLTLVLWTVIADGYRWIEGDGVYLEPIYTSYLRLFRDGEIVSASCKTHNVRDKLRMLYYDNENHILFDTGVISDSEIKFRSYMHSGRNNSHLDCYYYLPGQQGTRLGQIKFVLEQRLKATRSVWVNGTQITDPYIYPCIDGEQFELHCGTAPASKVLCFLQWQYYNCGITEDPIQVMFNPDLNYYEHKTPRLAGLRRDNILYEYTSSTSEWTIHYQFSGNDVLNLTCVSRVYPPHSAILKLTYQGKLMDGKSQILNFYNGESVLPQSLIYIDKVFKFNNGDDGTTLQCQTFSQNSDKVISTVILKLHLNPKKTSNYGADDVAHIKETKKDVSNWGMNIVYAFSVIAVVISCAVMIFWLKKRNRNYNKSTNNIKSGQNNTSTRVLDSLHDNVENHLHYAQIDLEDLVENDLNKTPKTIQKKNTIDSQDYANIKVPSLTEAGDTIRTKDTGDNAVDSNSVLELYSVVNKNSNRPKPLYDTIRVVKDEPVYQNPFNR